MKNRKDGEEFASSGLIDSIVVIPTLNEAVHIAGIVRDLRRDARAARRAEIWIVDGGSSDGTREIAGRLEKSGVGVRLVDNPEGTQACAVNLAALNASARSRVKYIIRADAHARYPANWISRLIDTAEAEGADSVVVAMNTRGGGAMRDASADLFNSWLGNGGSPHRSGQKRGFVQHGHHALFRLDAFLAAGGYDPRFRANEDAELDMRLCKLGKRIFLENRAAIDYFPRDTILGVFRQFFRNGRFRLCTSLKHGQALGPRQLAPIALVVGLLGSALAGVFIHPALAAPVALYAIAVAVSAWIIASAKSLRRVALIAATAATAHVAFGLGALQSAVDFIRGRALPAGGASLPATGAA